ncbi:MAG TPA: F0F1 ATP synthase subunit B [Parvularculaceae bacterium]|nr:F0F1 ATP synthase subunit B [Parvularculaceae bacterium]
MFASIAAILAAAAEEAAHGAADAHEASGGLLQDTSFWVLLAFLIVIGLFWKFGVHKMIADGLDKRAQNIADELDRARALSDEAQELLAKYQRRQREAEEEAADIIEQAKRDAQRLTAEAHEKIEEQIARRTKAAEEKIARAEAQAIAEMRSRTAELAVEAAREIIGARMDQGAQSALAERAIDEIRTKLH